MAVIPYTIVPTPRDGRCFVVQWILTGSDTGQPLMAPHASDKTIQIYGTFGAGSMAIHGALHFATPIYDVLDDVNAVALTAITTTKTKAIQPNVTFLAPIATNVTSVTIVCLLSGQQLISI